MLKRLFVICLFLWGCSLCCTAETANDDSFEKLCLKHEKHLMNLEVSRGLKSKLDPSRNIGRNYMFLNKQLEPYFNKIKDLNQHLDADDIRKMLSIFRMLGKVNTFQGTMYYSPVIEDSPISEIIVSALSSNFPEVRKRAAKMLIHFQNEELKRLSPQILPALEKNDLYQWEFVHFNKSQQEKYKFIHPKYKLKKYSFPKANARCLCVWAKLGDKAAFDEMIRKFKNTLDFRSKEYLVFYLGLIGNRRAITALLDELNDNHIPTKGLTLRYYILPAIWRNYPKDELFLKHCQLISLGDKYAKGKTGIKRFYKEIEKWSKEKLDYDLNLDSADPTISNPLEPIVF